MKSLIFKNKSETNKQKLTLLFAFTFTIIFLSLLTPSNSCGFEYLKMKEAKRREMSDSYEGEKFTNSNASNTNLKTKNRSKNSLNAKAKAVAKAKAKKTDVQSVFKLKVQYEDINTWHNIRIKTDFSGLVSKNLYAHNLTNVIKNKVIPKTMKVLSELFKVRKAKRFTLDQRWCNEYKIPKKLYNKSKPVEDTDLLIFVNFDQSGEYTKYRIEASAIHCYQDITTNRPIVGLVTYRDNLKINTKSDEDYLVWLTLHEISHVLLFNEDMYPDFIDSKMHKLPLNQIFYEEKNKFNQKVMYVKTPTVLREARKHFNCPTLKGLPLEYNGRESATGGHWSRRAMNTDYMIGRSHGENLISPMTLAFFQDSGWYKVDMNKHSIYFWGKNKGCGFFEKSCVQKSSQIKSLRHTFIELMKKHNEKNASNIKFKYRNSVEGKEDSAESDLTITSQVMSVKTSYNKEFCEEINQPVCSMHNIFRGFCGARLFGRDLPKKHRNFSNARLGGFDIFMNHCPIVVENKFGRKWYGGNCKWGEQKDLAPYEKVSLNSGCFISSLSKQLKHSSIQDVEQSAWNLEVYSIPNIVSAKAACIEFSCKKGEIFIKIEGKDYHCPSKKVLRINGYHGVVECPDKEVMCSNRYKCKFGCTSVQ